MSRGSKAHPDLTLTLVLPLLCSRINLKIEKTAEMSGRTHWRGARVVLMGRCHSGTRHRLPGMAEDRDRPSSQRQAGSAEQGE